MIDIKYDYDYIIVGSGFGGSVSAMRLAQKGYSVCVIESGRRYKAEDFPETNWNLRRFMWFPQLFLYGIWRFRLFRNVLVLAGSGVGGGSLNYANTLYVPPEEFFESSTISSIGGRKKLRPYYELAKKMLGVVENPVETEADKKMKETAKEMGFGESYRPTPVGVFFGKENENCQDPFFLGEGFDRTGCKLCGGCMTGCKYNAKNTLDKNYLFFAEKFGAKIIPENMVVEISPLSEDGKKGYCITSQRTTGFRSPKSEFKARGIIVSAGVMGTLSLLMKMKQNEKLPGISDRIGKMVRTNSESLLAITAGNSDIDYSHGVAITSSVFPDEHTHIEPVRFSKGSNIIGLFTTLLTDGGRFIPRQLSYIINCLLHPVKFFRLISPVGFASKSIIMLVMQSLDNNIEISRRRHFFWPFWKTLASKPDSKKTIPTYIPVANKFARKLAVKMNGLPANTINEVFLDTPTTAHILGGCPIGNTPEEGVVDLKNRVFGYKNMLICDGSMMPTNLGVNPSLTITALTERAMSFINPREQGKIRFLKAEQKWKTTALLNSNPASEIKKTKGRGIRKA